MHTGLPIVAPGSGRSCGTCDQCCRLIGVHDAGIDKPPGVPCEHLCNASCGQCGIYETRPSSCKHYSCMWLDGDLPEDAKPEHSGVIGEICHVSPGDGGPGFRLITVVSRSASELHTAIKRWFDPMLNDGTVIIGFVTTTSPDVPEIVVATAESHRRLLAFQLDIRKNGVALQAADGLQLFEPDHFEDGAEDVDRQHNALLPGGR